MPSNSYPIRLLLPGWEGNMNIKFVSRLELTALPNMILPRKLMTSLAPKHKVLWLSNRG